MSSLVSLVKPCDLEVGELVLVNIPAASGEVYPTGADVWENCIITDVTLERGRKVRRRKRYPRVEAVRFLRPCGREIVLRLSTLEDWHWQRALHLGQRYDRRSLWQSVIRYPE